MRGNSNVSPAITQGVRDYDVIRRKRNRSGGPAPRVISPRDPSEPVDPDAAPVLAVFDMDGTLLTSNIIETYLWVRLPELSPVSQVVELGEVLGRLPGYLLTEQRDRGSFLRAVYRRYRGLDLAELEHRVDTTMTDFILSRVSPDAIRRIGGDPARIDAMLPLVHPTLQISRGKRAQPRVPFGALVETGLVAPGTVVWDAKRRARRQRARQRRLGGSGAALPDRHLFVA